MRTCTSGTLSEPADRLSQLRSLLLEVHIIGVYRAYRLTRVRDAVPQGVHDGERQVAQGRLSVGELQRRTGRVRGVGANGDAVPDHAGIPWPDDDHRAGGVAGHGDADRAE